MKIKASRARKGVGLMFRFHDTVDLMRFATSLQEEGVLPESMHVREADSLDTEKVGKTYVMSKHRGFAPFLKLIVETTEEVSVEEVDDD